MFCSGQSHRKLADLHDRYGSVVRIGTNELSYTAPEAWNSIMGLRKGSVENPKAPWFCPPDGKHIACAPLDDHARMRRILAPIFTPSAIVKQQPLISSYLDLFIDKLHAKVRHGRAQIEIDSWLGYYAFDVIGDLALGQSFDCLQGSAQHPWISLIFANLRAGAIGVALKRFPLLRIVLPLLVPGRLRKLGEQMKEFIRERVATRLASQSPRADFIQTMRASKNGLVGLTKLESPQKSNDRIKLILVVP